MKGESTRLINRVLNFVIDTVIILILFYFFIRCAPFLLLFAPFDFELNINAILALLYLSYYILLEGITGRTVGKYLTKTKVISHDDQEISFFQAIIRTIVRLTFIEIFSFFSRRPIGWHDKASRTMVVKLN
jgi:uncharacterized RDD family membrane protein YckC